MWHFFTRLQGLGKLLDLATKHDRAVRQCFVSRVQRAAAAIRSLPAAIQSAWPEVQTNTVQKLPCHVPLWGICCVAIRTVLFHFLQHSTEFLS